ncbi:MAG: hypothetical protein CBD16_06435, partial [Betaproteobacteria bacterium TMED156]
MSRISNLSLKILNFFSWKIKNLPPVIEKYVLVAAPHTSNWDFAIMILTSLATQIKLRWMGKKSLFTWPFSEFMTALGGVPIDRSKRDAVVWQTAKKIKNSKQFVLVVPPEGTRSHTEFWKTGFLHISRSANVPIVFSYMDYEKKEIGFSEPINEKLDEKEILLLANNFYKNITGLYPENFGPIRFKEKK